MWSQWYTWRNQFQDNTLAQCKTFLSLNVVIANLVCVQLLILIDYMGT